MQTGAEESLRLKVRWWRFVAVFLVCSFAIAVIPSWREVVSLDGRMLFPLAHGEVLIGGLGKGCHPWRLPEVDTTTRRGEFTMLHPDQDAVAQASDHGLHGNPTAEERIAGAGVAIGDLTSRAFSRVGASRDLLERIRWAQGVEPSNGVLWLAEYAVLERNGRYLDRAGGSRDAAIAAARLAVARQPWNLHIRDMNAYGLDAWSRFGMPRYEAVRDSYLSLKDGVSDVWYLLRRLPTTIVQTGLLAKDREAFESAVELAVELTSVRWVGLNLSPKFWPSAEDEARHRDDDADVDTPGDVLADMAVSQGAPTPRNDSDWTARAKARHDLALTYLSARVPDALV
jgi:hypothetical protein